MMPLQPSQIMRAIVRAVPSVIPLLAPETLQALKAADNYDSIRMVMRADIWGSVFGYLSGGSLADARSRMATGVAKGYIETADAAFQDGGGELPIDEETASWAKGQLDAQLSFVDSLFDALKDIRKAGDFDAGDIASARADGYASALDGFYNEVRLRGSKNIIGYWRLGNTEKHCPSCSELNGQGHKISWYIERDYIPRKSGCALDCGGWECDCRLEDRFGNEITL